jgi:hypothetical protein
MEKLIPIHTHPGYFVDKLGNVYSNKAKGGGIRILKPRCRNKKDKHLSIMFSGDRKSYFVHRVIYEVFVGSIPEGKIICHKDDDPTNNAPENLYAGTHKENHADAKRNGRKPFGEKCVFSKLKEIDVLRILSLIGKTKNVDLAKEFNVSKSTITDIFKNRTWKHIKRSVEN